MKNYFRNRAAVISQFSKQVI